jgi:GxxExxY protein
MINEKYIHSDITSTILAAAFEVHRIIGCGFVESVYHRSLIIECMNRKIAFESEKELPIYYKNHKVGSRRVDLLFQQKVVAELKAVSKLEDIHLAQAINYLEVFNLDVGLLLNFGSKTLEYKRLVHPRLVNKTTPTFNQK